jgi:hypothetical protein
MDVAVFALATLVAVGVSLYLFALSRVDELKKNWMEYRCNPIYMPLAGFVGESVSANFTKCTMKGFQDYAGFVMDPLMAQFSIVNDTLGEVTGNMNSMRSMMGEMRGGFLGIVGSVFGKIQNLTSHIQYIMIRMRTLMSRIVGVMITFVYMFFTGVASGESVRNGPIMRTIGFLCFHPDTLISTDNENQPVFLRNVKIGDKLKGDATVTSVYQMSGEGVPMYSLYGTLVSGSHKVKFQKEFIFVRDHPLAKKVRDVYSLMCLNTTTHRIFTPTSEFLDFVENTSTLITNMKSKYVELIYNAQCSPSNLATSHVTGVMATAKVPLEYEDVPIWTVEVGDVLDNGDKVLGIVIHYVDETMYCSLAEGINAAPSTWILKDGSVRMAHTLDTSALVASNERYAVYQLITESNTFPIINSKNERIMILDELQTTDSHIAEVKDTIIMTGRFRGKEVVV